MTHEGGLSVGVDPKFCRKVWHQLRNETFSAGLKCSVKCQVTNSECQCRATLILGWISVSDGTNGPVSEISPSWALKRVFPVTLWKFPGSVSRIVFLPNQIIPRISSNDQNPKLNRIFTSFFDRVVSDGYALVQKFSPPWVKNILFYRCVMFLV